MAIPLQKLKPYASLLLCRTYSSDQTQNIITKILSDLTAMLGNNGENNRIQIIEDNGAQEEGNLTIGFLCYRETRRPSWIQAGVIQDTLHQLILVCLYKSYLAFYFSDPSWIASMKVEFLADPKGIGLKSLETIHVGRLHAAFATGQARTLWMSGIHTRTSVKADSKVLAGVDLRDALDPLGDQTYYPTALRCVNQFGKRRMPVGLSPRRSRVWVGISREWSDFYGYVTALFRQLEKTEKANLSLLDPLPVLATPIQMISGAHIENPFDVSIIAPESQAEDLSGPAALESRERLEAWAYEARFDVIRFEGLSPVADVYLNEQKVGRMTIAVDDADPKKITFSVTSEPVSGMEKVMAEGERICQNRHFLQIRYESGHTITDGQIFLPKFRDTPFPNWVFPDLTGVDILSEKPNTKKDNKTIFAPELVGTKGSLFCWVWNHWPNLDGHGRPRGWLACDDGANERADFIHLDTEVDPPLLTLIHVKAAHSDSPSRDASVTAYEVVTAQAVKNLRNLDSFIVSDGLAEGIEKQIGKLVWHNGRPHQTRAKMLTAIRRVGANYKRRVVILQPHMTSRALEAARADQEKQKDRERNSGKASRIRQLDSLLLGAEAVCHGLSAELLVVGDGSPLKPGKKTKGKGKGDRK